MKESRTRKGEHSWGTTEGGHGMNGEGENVCICRSNRVNREGVREAGHKDPVNLNNTFGF